LVTGNVELNAIGAEQAGGDAQAMLGAI